MSGEPFESSSRTRVFLLSPASSKGRRAQMLMRPGADFALAKRLRSSEGAPIGDVFSFMSGLYFRGKLTYARAFPWQAYVITPCLGLAPLDQLVTPDILRRFAEVDIHEHEERFRGPMLRDARQLEIEHEGDAEVVLLGSIASKKYVEILLDVFDDRLMFPSAFVGRGDMSRGGLLLRAAEEAKELDYAPVRGAVLHGKRPPKLEPVKPRR